MAHILIITSGLTGIANASLELGRRLVSMGHEVTMSSMRDLKDFYTAYGFSYHQMPEVVEEVIVPLPPTIAASNKLVKKVYRILNKAKISKQAYEQFYPSQYITDLEAIDPDLTIIDTELHEFIIPTFAAKRPILILSQWFQLREFDDLPYLLTDTIPGVGPSGSAAAIKANWAKLRSDRKAIFDHKAKATNHTDRRSLVLKLAAELTFPMEYIADNYWPGPVTYQDLPIISMTAYELEFPYNRPSNFTYIGPMVYKGRVQKTDHKVEEVLTQFLAKKTATGSKLVVCTVSTMSAGDLKFINKVIAAVEGLEDTMLIVGLGGKLSKADVADHSDKVLTMDYVPMLQLLPKADLSINHAGIHTINECIEFGVPMLVYSGKKSDQDGCAARVHYHGLGIRGDKDQEGTASIAANIQTVLHDTQYGENIEAMQEKVARYKNNTQLEKAITQAMHN